MTLQEILKKQGLTDEQITAALADMKANKLFTAGEENLDIRYKDLQGKFEGKDKEHKEAAALIEQLKKDNAGNDTLQTKVTEYETKMAQLQTELQQTKIDSALKVALLENKGFDVDYLTFKIKEKGELKIGDDGKIKGLDETITAMKTQYPTQFSTDSKKKVEENKLPAGDGGKDNTISREQFGKMGYKDRLDLYKENPDAYKELSKPE